MAVDIYFEVDDAGFISAMHKTEEQLDKLLTAVATDLAHSLADEGEQFSARLGKPWKVEGLTSPTSRTVVAPEWWAHIVAHGSKDHGPRKADKLVFEADGELVFARMVRGIPATNFDQKAIDRTRSHVDDILRRLL